MPMRDDFCIFILTNGRPDRVFTYNCLERAGYTGKVFIVIDDEDKTADAYRARFGDKVLQFCKADIAKQVDTGDNFDGRVSTIYPRAAFWDMAKQKGCKYFLQRRLYTFPLCRYLGTGCCSSLLLLKIFLTYFFTQSLLLT